MLSAAKHLRQGRIHWDASLHSAWYGRVSVSWQAVKKAPSPVMLSATKHLWWASRRYGPTPMLRCAQH